MKNIYVGNLPYDTTNEELAEAFQPFGSVHRATLVVDRDTGRPRGFGFVEMIDDDDADTAIEEMHGFAFNGRPLTVNEARRSREDRERPMAPLPRPSAYQPNFRPEPRYGFVPTQLSRPEPEPMEPPARDPEVHSSRGYSNSLYTREAG